MELPTGVHVRTCYRNFTICAREGRRILRLFIGLAGLFFYRASNEEQRSKQLWQLKEVPLVQVVSGVWKLDLPR